MARLVVQKYGGSSLADADRIRHVARRIARERDATAPTSWSWSARWATRPTTCSTLAARITDEPDPREMDLLLATGEHMSGTLVAMALHALGLAAISLTGAAGRHPHRSGARPGAHRQRRAGARPARSSSAGAVVIVAGFQGVDRRVVR